MDDIPERGLEDSFSNKIPHRLFTNSEFFWESNYINKIEGEIGSPYVLASLDHCSVVQETKFLRFLSAVAVLVCITFKKK